jgi:Glycosyl hydrolase family 20, catalytic domain/Glycosyl hydrolase family 20, domain 2
MRIRTHISKVMLVLFLMAGLNTAIASPLFSPQPKRVILKDAFVLSNTFSLHTKGSGLPDDDPGLQRLREVLARRNVSQSRNGAFKITVSRIGKSALCRQRLESVAATEALPGNEEAYFIEMNKDGAVVGGHSERAVYYGLLTLAQWLDSSSDAEVQGGWVLDWPSLQHRSMMLDMARLMEKKSYYEKVMKFLAENKYNVFLLHLTDEPLVTLKFKKHPAPACPYAWTVEEMKDFIALADKYHIDLMPEIELFGHAGGVLRHPDYKQYGEPRGGSFSPHHPKIYDLMEDFVEETSDIFPYSMLHAGLDEVGGPYSEAGKAFVKEHGKNRWLTDHIRKLHEIITRHNKRMVMWGDMLLKRPGTANAIPRDVLIYDWHYYYNMGGKVRTARIPTPPESWKIFRELGFDIVSAPSLMAGGHRLWPDYQRLNNSINSATEAAIYGLEGVSITVWAPARFLPESMWYGYALSGNAAWAGSDFERVRAEKAFFHNYFGLELTAADREQLNFLLEYTPTREDILRLLWFDKKRKARYLKSGGDRIKDCLEGAVAAHSYWKRRAGDVKLHRAEFEDMIRVARIIEHMAWREKYGKAILTDPAADKLREQCVQETKAILREIRASWDPHRHWDAPVVEGSFMTSHSIRRDFTIALKTLEKLDVK